MKKFFDKIMKNTSVIVAIIGVSFSLLATLFTIIFNGNYLSESKYFLEIITGVLTAATFGIALISLKTVLGKKRVFISYSHTDKDFVFRLYKELQVESEKTFNRKYRFLIDEDIISLGDNISIKITQTIGDCDAFIVVFSSTSLQSEYMKLEIEQIIKRHKKIIPILFSSEADKAKIPENLANIKYLSINSTEEESIQAAARKIFDSIRK